MSNVIWCFGHARVTFTVDACKDIYHGEDSAVHVCLMSYGVMDMQELHLLSTRAKTYITVRIQRYMCV